MFRILVLMFVLWTFEGVSCAASACAPGAFQPLVGLVPGGAPVPLFPPGSANGAFVLGADTVTIGACGSTSAVVKPRRRYTWLRRVAWETCPGFGRVHFRGGLRAPSCNGMIGVLRWRDPEDGRRHALKFEASRIDD